VILEYFRKMVTSLEKFTTALSPDLLSPSPSTSSAIKTPDPQPPDPSASPLKTEQPNPHQKKRKKGNLMPSSRWKHLNEILL
jgi:hypothetical protein